MYEKIKETATWLKQRMTTQPKTAIILGTGLGQLASEITDAKEIAYKEIPNFPVSTVEGHAGKLIFGKLGGKDIMAMDGRFHFYEGLLHERSHLPHPHHVRARYHHAVCQQCLRWHEPELQDRRPDDH